MFSFQVNGDFAKTEQWLQKMKDGNIYTALEKYGAEGVAALRSATPVESGETAAAWTYEVKKDAKSYSIIWSNTHVENGRPIAILLQLGHGTGTGGYVQGRDFINPALRPIFDQMVEAVWKEVTA